MSLAPHAATTEDLALAASLGDSDALTLLYERLADRLITWLELKTSRNVGLAQEVSSATWEKVARKIRDYEAKRGGFEAWLFTIAGNELRAYYRWSGRHPERLTGEMLTFDSLDLSDCPESIMDRRYVAQRIATEVAALSKHQRECVHYRFVMCLDLAETASAMGRNVNTIKQLQFRAMRNLARRLGEDLDVLASVPRAAAASHLPEQAVIPAVPAGKIVSLTQSTSGGVV